MGGQEGVERVRGGLAEGKGGKRERERKRAEQGSVAVNTAMSAPGHSGPPTSVPSAARALRPTPGTARSGCQCLVQWRGTLRHSEYA